jgi:hypothetical protein
MIRPMNFKPFNYLVIAGVAFALLAQAAPLRKDTPPPPEEWQKRWWIEKAVRVLRMGEGLRPSERIQDLLQMDRELILDHLMGDPVFQNTIVDFGFFFQGLRSPVFRAPREQGGWHYGEVILNSPQLITAAKAFSSQNGSSGDFLSILKIASNEIYNLPSYDMGPSSDEERGLSEEILINKVFSNYQTLLSHAIKIMETDPVAGKTFVCGIGSGGHRGLNQALTIWLTKDDRAFGKILSYCFDQERLSTSPTNILNELKRILEFNKKLFKKLKPFHRSRYSVHTIDDFKTLDFSDLPPESRPIIYTIGTDDYSLVLTNSSTNYDRRRAAHILRRYFCDDLTPINFLPPDEHSKGRHASEPSCRACHYKLDPMAGFFREYGFYFINFSHMDKILFDDFAVANLSDYQNTWRANPGSPREWNVGYVRSVEQEELNSYGSSLDDLSNIIYEAPEARKCLVKKMFEYFVGENQAIDSGYIDHLTTEMLARPQNGYADGGRFVIKQLLLGGTFSKNDPMADECYDHAPGYIPENSPPCKVAFVLQKNCATCHSPASMKGRLDLTSWVKYGENQYTFPHFNRAGEQVSPQRTFQSILDRITSSDPEVRMPLDKYMSATDREAIFLWARERVSN